MTLKYWLRTLRICAILATASSHTVLRNPQKKSCFVKLIDVRHETLLRKLWFAAMSFFLKGQQNEVWEEEEKKPCWYASMPNDKELCIFFWWHWNGLCHQDILSPGRASHYCAWLLCFTGWLAWISRCSPGFQDQLENFYVETASLNTVILDECRWGDVACHIGPSSVEEWEFYSSLSVVG